MQSSNSTIADIKERLNVVDVLSTYIPLKKAGANYKANCPFHHENTPSLVVSPSKQVWHCFGCGEGGDILAFVMKFENLDFPEVLKLLANRAGVELPKYNQENAKEDQYKERLFKINDLAAKFYNKILLDSSVSKGARSYLESRGLSAETIKEWQIGFAPEGFHVLEGFLIKKGFSEKELVDSGVCSKSERGGVYDRFFNRITFPIKNYSGEVVGFTARQLVDDKKSAKYINSPETLIYSKSKVIFGLYEAKQAIRKADAVVVVEGNMDVISAHQAGFKNVVASSGTAFTYEQLQILSRLTKNLKFAFDTDAAGVVATRRALEIALQLGFSVYIVKIENAKDPDELIKKDREAFTKAIEKAPLYLDYFFDKSFTNYDPNSVEQKKQIVANLLPLLQKINDPIEVSHYTKMFAQRLGLTESTVYELIARNKTAKVEKKAPTPVPLVRSRSYNLEQKVLGYALFKQNYAKKVIEVVQAEDFKDRNFREIYEKWAKQPNFAQIEVWVKSLDAELQELAKMALFMVESEYNDWNDPHAFDKEFQNTLKEFKENSVRIAMKSVVAEMVIAEQNKDKERLAQLNTKFLELSKVLKNNQ
jgi:DNA primase